MEVRMPHQHAKKALEQRQASPSIYTDIEWLTFPAEWRPCDVLPLSWVNGQPPYSILGTWWSDESALSDAEGRQWLVAGDIDDNAYNWTAAIPSNSTLHLTLIDSSQFIQFSKALHIHVNYTSIRGYNSSWCLEDDPTAIQASLGLQAFANSTSNDTTSSDRVYTPTRVAPESAPTVTVTQWPTGDYWSEPYRVEQKIRALSAALGVFVLLFVIMCGVSYWTWRRLKRMENLGNWMRKVPGQSSINTNKDTPPSPSQEKKGWETFGTSTSAQSTTLFSKNPLSSMSSALFLPLTPGSPKFGGSSAGSSFASRSASRALNGSASRDKTDAFMSAPITRTNTGTTTLSSMSNSNPFEDYSESLSPISSRQSEPRSQSRPLSTSETIQSETHTVQSSSHFSSIAPSENPSTVGGMSTVSDEYWSRTKASTISPVTPSSGRSKAFLIPRNGDVGGSGRGSR